jgi:hypothetical protein
MHVITPSDLLKFQIEHYSEMLLKPRSFEHKIFLRKQLKQLQNDIPVNTILHNKCYSNHFSNILSQKLERI